MTPRGLYRLMVWLSPSYPVGAYSFSHGLEAAGEAGVVEDPEALRDWIAMLLQEGAGRGDGAFLAHAHRRAEGPSVQRLREVHELALAFQPSAELALETQAQGTAFLRASRRAWPCPALDRLAALVEGPVAYPVAVGVAARGHDLPLEDTLNAYLGAFAGNLVSAALRLLPIGQSAGQEVLAALADSVDAAAARAAELPLEEVATAVPGAELLSMSHETQYTRLFRS